MPFPRNWVEELITEWLHLEGYLVEANFPVATTSVGGRGEADVVGGKMIDGLLEILHIETGQLAGGQSSIDSVRNKFRDEIEKSLISYFSQIFSSSNPQILYKPMYIPSYWTRPTVSGIESLGVEVYPLPDFIQEMILPTIEKWKEDPPHAPKSRGSAITLPESFWLMQFLDHMKTNGLLK